MPIAHINGIKINYQDSGGLEKPVILFSHGFMMDHSMFKSQIDRFSSEFRCIAWDERGFGETPTGDKPFTYWDSASDAIGLLDHVGVEKAVFCGMSQGGYLSLRAAISHPDRVQALIIIDSKAQAETPDTCEQFKQMLTILNGDDEEAYEQVLAGIANMILGDDQLNTEWMQKWRARRKTHPLDIPMDTLITRDDITDRIASIKCPTLVIHGTADKAIDIYSGIELSNALPNCHSFVQVEDAAHAPNMSHPDIVNEAIATFLSSHITTAARTSSS
mmetsp:Transcript_19920/g.25787  ORF Transcript_19920/g.25787 Transcript_19920/m.25787 type:complete len:275 (+) Transcript_19920:52-876(+)|eukprot:CAMPEP_0197299104 /NCGR_PEP_ID=MMETSP0890-20130614/45247_1 /TAXON_ID=44058 ORGANISM="Aureoumbra lagunensis, Strain CCMP1510" /NCGR_SAMPLE_ID=MMETSP0890 /ASSEMBLY_ACC=CAM_ASM_000533 /LENGTH=274 /DNA_ID=CAMNT_0042777257 /DNA_START=1 /DNA_END=825 /DNA_ORIENTATION=+